MIKALVIRFKRPIKWTISTAISIASMALFYPKLFLYRLRSNKFDNLHIGCGKNKLSGWINADIHPSAEIIVFMQHRIPFRDGSLSRVYSEHVLEHVDISVAKHHLLEVHRALRVGGILRVAMPDLDDVIECYLKDWRSADWVNWSEFKFVESRVHAINMAFREWGHKYLYNKEEVERLLRGVGFESILFESFGHSGDPVLCGLETRRDSKLIVEARKL